MLKIVFFTWYSRFYSPRMCTQNREYQEPPAYYNLTVSFRLVLLIKALHSVIVIGDSIKIKFEMSILQLEKFNFNVLILIHSKTVKTGSVLYFAKQKIMKQSASHRPLLPIL